MGVKVTLMKEMARGDPGISAETAASSKKNNAWMDGALRRRPLSPQSFITTTRLAKKGFYHLLSPNLKHQHWQA